MTESQKPENRLDYLDDQEKTPSLRGVSLTLPELPSWVKDDYASSITGSGALKLADSGVAPLIAAARGYKRIDETNFDEELRTMGVSKTTAQGRRLKNILTHKGWDGMQMPWYSIAAIHSALRKGEDVSPFTYQIRPEHPENNRDGKPIKYEFLGGQMTPIDLHPSVPVEWIDGAPTVMFAEGMLKGDAALSAYLHAVGVPYEDLRSEGVEDPREKLRELMNSIPEADRVAILSFGGVNNQTQVPADWREITLKDRTGWIAFDADMGINANVYRQAKILSEYLEDKARMKKVLFLNPKVTNGDDGEMSKAGVDDYLAKMGDWNGLVGSLTEHMPPVPPKSTGGFMKGEARVHRSGGHVEEFEPSSDGSGSGTWMHVVPLGGRVVSTEIRRQATDEELRTGKFNPNLGADIPENKLAEIEVAWIGDDGALQTETIVGPEAILTALPVEWIKMKAEVPTALMRHPEWPPRGAKAETWMRAIKANRQDEIVTKTRWLQMGWVPVETGDPAFIVGDQIIGDDGVMDTVLPGVTSSQFEKSAQYGVELVKNADFDDEAYKKIVRDDIKSVVDTYVKSNAWTDRSAAAIVLAGALRPAIPVRPQTTIFFYGPKNRGKSMTAEYMMYFWSRHKTSWVGKDLPGSAKDTYAAMENAISYAPLWVIDDWAPSPTRKQAEAEETKIGDIARSVFNQTSKMRMNADMTAKKSNRPVSVLVVTAENEMTTPSIRDRLIPVYIGPGKLHPSKKPTDDIRILAGNDGAPARLTGHLIRYIRHAAATTPRTGTTTGWEESIARLHATQDFLKESVQARMVELGASGGSLVRSSTLCADLLLALKMLQTMGSEVDLDDEYIDLLSELEGGIGDDVISLIVEAHRDNQSSTPGISLVRALGHLLQSGGAHVISADDPQRPPMTGNELSDKLSNHMLGWTGSTTDGEPKPSGPVIGRVVTMADSEGVQRRVVLFDRETSFNLAKHHYPTLITHGQGAAAGWMSVWDEGLAPSFVNRMKQGGKSLTTIRLRNKMYPGNGIMGVPVEVSVLQSGGVRDTSGDDSEG